MIALAPWTGWLAWSAVAAGGVGLGALYAGLETGIYVLNKIRLELRAEAGERPARSLLRHVNKTDSLLATLLVGTNVSGYVTTFAISAMFVLAGAGGRAEWYTIATATPLMFVLRESVPKIVFQRLAERLVYRLWWFLSVSRALFVACGLAPLVRGFSWLLMTATGMRKRLGSMPAYSYALDALVAEGAASGLLTHFQSVMAQRVMGLADVTLGDVMIPMARAATAEEDISAEAFRQKLTGHDYSRIPLRDAAGQVAGIVDIYDVLTDPAGRRPREFAATPLVLSADTGVLDALLRMQRARAAMAIVHDAADRHVGLATVKDLVEEIVGELEEW